MTESDTDRIEREQARERAREAKTVLVPTLEDPRPPWWWRLKQIHQITDLEFLEP